MKPVENGDKIRIDKLEVAVTEVRSEVATLTGTVGASLKQVAIHRQEAIAENVTRDALANTHHGQVMSAINANAAELATFNRLDKDRSERAPAGLVSAEFPAHARRMPTRKQAAIGTGLSTGVGAIGWLLWKLSEIQDVLAQVAAIAGGS